MKILPDTTQRPLAQRKMFYKVVFSLQYFFFFSFFPGRGGVSTSSRQCMLANRWKPQWGGLPRQRDRLLGWLWHVCLGCHAWWPLSSGGRQAWPAGGSEHQSSPIQEKPFLLISKMWPLSSATGSRLGSVASPSPSSSSLGWALEFSSVWELPFDLRFSLEKGKLFPARPEPSRSYSPINIFSFVSPRTVIWVIVLPYLLSHSWGNPKPYINHNTSSSQFARSVFTHPLDAHLTFSILFPTTSRSCEVTHVLVVMCHQFPRG